MARWYWVVAVWGVVLGGLLSFSHASRAIPFVGVGLLAVHVTNWIVRFFQSASPRKIISDVKGKAVFITGCDSGFGYKAALRLDRLGFKVFAGCLFPDSEGVDNLKKEASRHLRVIKCDVTKQKDITQAYEAVHDELDLCNERLWAVVNNAGVAAMVEVEWCPVETYQHVMDVNAIGPIRVTKTFLPLLRQYDNARIIIVASLAGRYTFPGFTAYSMSKHAAVSFADGLRLEMKKWNISVHTIEPTLYKTPISNEVHLQKAVDESWEKSSEEVRMSYGDEYLRDFKMTMSLSLQRAKPAQKVEEVVADMVDAVAGAIPKTRYIPSLETQVRSELLSALPTDLLDTVLLKSTPKTPPAYIQENKRKSQPPLIDPRKFNNFRRKISRGYSEPSRQKHELTPPAHSKEKFTFDDEDC